MDLTCTAGAKLLGDEDERERRDAHNSKEQDLPSLDRGVPQANVDFPAGPSDGSAGNPLSRRTDGPDQTAGQLACTGYQRVRPRLDLRVLNRFRLNALGFNQAAKERTFVLQKFWRHSLANPSTTQTMMPR